MDAVGLMEKCPPLEVSKKECQKHDHRMPLYTNTPLVTSQSYGTRQELSFRQTTTRDSPLFVPQQITYLYQSTIA